MCFAVSCGSTKTFAGVEEAIDFAIRKTLKQFLVSSHLVLQHYCSGHQHLLTSLKCVKVLPKEMTVHKAPNYQIPLTPLEKHVKAK